MHRLFPLCIGAIDAVAKTAEFDYCGSLIHCSDLRVGMPQQVMIFHSDAYLRIDDRFVAQRPDWRRRMCDCVLSVNEVIEGDVAKSISNLGYCG